MVSGREVYPSSPADAVINTCYRRVATRTTGQHVALAIKAARSGTSIYPLNFKSKEFDEDATARRQSHDSKKRSSVESAKLLGTATAILQDARAFSGRRHPCEVRPENYYLLE
jgi:hypothetical protein